MTHADKILTTKATNTVIIGVSLTLASGLSQWADSGQSPGTIAWVIIIATCLGNGASKLNDFLSSSYSEYLAKKETDNAQSLTNTATKQP